MTPEERADRIWANRAGYDCKHTERKPRLPRHALKVRAQAKAEEAL
jgi:hypothetical protein